jgi:predicted transcriptional regulator
MLYDLKKIKQMRLQLGLTQAHLAKLANVSQSLITKIERGRIEPSYSLARKIFLVLEEQLAKTHKAVPAKTISTKNIAFIKPTDSLDKAVKLMKKHAISQIPVIDKNIIVGSISEETLIRKFDEIKERNMKVGKIMDAPFPTIPEDTPITLIRDILKTYSAVIITKNGKTTGIITRADLLKRL